jgi:hypothetical protein
MKMFSNHVNFNGKISKWARAYMAKNANYYGLAMCTVVIQMWPRHMIIFLCLSQHMTSRQTHKII